MKTKLKKFISVWKNRQIYLKQKKSMLPDWTIIFLPMCKPTFCNYYYYAKLMIFTALIHINLKKILYRGVPKFWPNKTFGWKICKPLPERSKIFFDLCDQRNFWIPKYKFQSSNIKNDSPKFKKPMNVVDLHEAQYHEIL